MGWCANVWNSFDVAVIRTYVCGIMCSLFGNVTTKGHMSKCECVKLFCWSHCKMCMCEFNVFCNHFAKTSARTNACDYIFWWYHNIETNERVQLCETRVTTQILPCVCKDKSLHEWLLIKSQCKDIRAHVNAYNQYDDITILKLQCNNICACVCTTRSWQPHSSAPWTRYIPSCRKPQRWICIKNKGRGDAMGTTTRLHSPPDPPLPSQTSPLCTCHKPGWHLTPQ